MRQHDNNPSFSVVYENSEQLKFYSFTVIPSKVYTYYSYSYL